MAPFMQLERQVRDSSIDVTQNILSNSEALIGSRNTCASGALHVATYSVARQKQRVRCFLMRDTSRGSARS